MPVKTGEGLNYKTIEVSAEAAKKLKEDGKYISLEEAKEIVSAQTGANIQDRSFVPSNEHLSAKVEK